MSVRSQGRVDLTASFRRAQLRGKRPLAAAAIWIRTAALLNTVGVALTCWASISIAFAGAPDTTSSSLATVSAVVGTRMQASHVGLSHPIANAHEVAPSLDRLPRATLPKGFFYAWCGQDSFLIEDGKQFIFYGPDLKRGTVVSIAPVHVQCDQSSSRIAWQDNTNSSIKVVNLEDGRVDTLATMRKTGFPVAIYSLSPDFSALAYDPHTVEVQLPEAGGPKLIPVTVGEGVNAGAIHWSSDSSRLFHVLKPDLGARSGGSAYYEILELVDTDGNRVRGQLPRGFSFANEGIFISGSEDVLLYMRPRNNDLAPGAVFRCTSRPIRCEPSLSGVDEPLLSAQGLIGIVKGPLGSKREHRRSDAQVATKYVLELMSVDGTVQYAQQYADSEEVNGLVLKLAPSGRRAIVIRFSRSLMCDRGIGASPCQIGEVRAIEGGRDGISR